MTNIAITASRTIEPPDRDIIRSKMLSLCQDTSITSIYLGGAIGGDTLALECCLELDIRPQLIVVVPCRLENQPVITRSLSLKANEVIELNNEITPNDGFYAYKLRNMYLVDKADRLVAFWTGDTKSGTYQTITYARKQSKPVDVVKIGNNI